MDPEQTLRQCCEIIGQDPIDLPGLEDAYIEAVCDGPWGRPDRRGQRVSLLVKWWLAETGEVKERALAARLEINPSRLSQLKNGDFAGAALGRAIHNLAQLVGCDLRWIWSGCQVDPRSLPIHDPFMYLLGEEYDGGWLVPPWLRPYTIACNNAKWIFARITDQEESLTLAHKELSDPAQSAIEWAINVVSLIAQAVSGSPDDENWMPDYGAIRYAWFFPTFYRIWSEIEKVPLTDTCKVDLTSDEIRILMSALLRADGEADALSLQAADWTSGKSTGTPLGNLFDRLACELLGQIDGPASG